MHPITIEGTKKIECICSSTIEGTKKSNVFVPQISKIGLEAARARADC
jgi:hypothetical protein